MSGEGTRGMGEPGAYDPLTSLLVLTARIETQLQGLTDSKRAEHERLSMEIARVERDAARDLAEIKAEHGRQINDLYTVVQSLRLSWAKAAGIAAVVAVVLSTVLTALVNRLMGGAL